MGKKVTKNPQVFVDLVEQADFIATDSVDAAECLLDAAESTFQFLADMPEVGTACSFKNPQAVGIRVWAIKGFKNHLVFYRPTEEGIEVVRVIHAARDMEQVFTDEYDDTD